jgi:hypothetical protein
VSTPSQKSPSSQGEPSGSGAVQLWVGSSHDWEQLASPPGTGHGLPVEMQAPLRHTSMPSQKMPSSAHGLPSGSGPVHESVASLHDSEQLPSPSGAGHGSPE